MVERIDLREYLGAGHEKAVGSLKLNEYAAIARNPRYNNARGKRKLFPIALKALESKELYDKYAPILTISHKRNGSKLTYEELNSILPSKEKWDDLFNDHCPLNDMQKVVITRVLKNIPVSFYRNRKTTLFADIDYNFKYDNLYSEKGLTKVLNVFRSCPDMAIMLLSLSNDSKEKEILEPFTKRVREVQDEFIEKYDKQINYLKARDDNWAQAELVSVSRTRKVLVDAECSMAFPSRMLSTEVKFKAQDAYKEVIQRASKILEAKGEPQISLPDYNQSDIKNFRDPFINL